ncbi:endonuclease/exonuclease/phosphatase family protein [Nonomuraea insulae]|uniref:Endonuclease/exonuclease/phosphatase family protein n=1 Tax=Nonomuraea insulae TaxID=1616787 RepID=A0ABW1CHQ4_9ACTN
MRVVAALVCAMALAAGPQGAHADTADPANWPTPRFITYNVKGAAQPIYAGNRQAWADKIVGAMDYWNTDLIMFQEMCYGQYQTLRQAVGDAYDSVWGASLASASGCSQWGSDKRFGLAIFAKGGPGTIDNGTRVVHTLPRPAGGEARIELCARTVIRSHSAWACNTHLDFHAGNKEAQAAAVAAHTDAYVDEGYPVVLAGDFNMFPTEAPLKHLYDHHGGTGLFQEVDENDKAHFTGTECPQSGDRCRSGEATEDPVCSPDTDQTGKIDYIFVSALAFGTVRGDAAACTPGLSDHHLLRGAAGWA